MKEIKEKEKNKSEKSEKENHFSDFFESYYIVIMYKYLICKKKKEKYRSRYFVFILFFNK